MKKWNEFLSSLGTRGGAIFLLTLIFTGGVCVIIHMIHRGESQSELGAGLMTTFSGFSGALLMALKGSSDSTATVSTPGGSATASTATASTDPTPDGSQATARTEGA